MRANRILGFISRAALAVLIFNSPINPCTAGVAVSIGQNFTGSSSSNDGDPAPNVAASADYVAEFNRDSFAVYSKTDGSVVQSMNTVQFWTSAGVTLYPNTCGTGPRLVYDPTVQRWFAAQVLFDCDLSSSTALFRLAVSESADPTGPWHGATLPENAGATNNISGVVVYVGLDAQGVYFSSVVWPTNANAFHSTGSVMWSLPKVDLLAIPPIITNRTWFGQLYASKYGYSLAPAICFDGSAGGDVLAPWSDGVDPITGNPMTTNTLVAFAIQNAGGSSPATLGSRQTFQVQPYTEPTNWGLQPDGSMNLVDGDATFTANAYRVGDVLFATQGIQYGPRIAVRWYRISAANHALLESGTITDPSLDFYFPSITANTNGTVALAFNGSGSNIFISCYAAVGQTVHGVTTFGSPLLLQSGKASYQNPPAGGQYSSWGTFSTICVDPTAPNIFWTINAYASGPTTWSTQITQILTSPSPQLSMASTASGVVLSWPVTAVPFQLQSSPSLPAGGSWSPVAQTATTNGNTVSLLVSPTNTSAFFRLVQTQ